MFVFGCGHSAVDCHPAEFRCFDNKKCVKLPVLCDTVDDCDDGSDEDKKEICGQCRTDYITFYQACR